MISSQLSLIVLFAFAFQAPPATPPPPCTPGGTQYICGQQAPEDLVLLPNSDQSGISRKIEIHEERQRLKKTLRELHVPDGPIPLLLRRVDHAVDSDVDDHGSRLHHGSSHELRTADRCDENVRGAGDAGEVVGPRVAHGDRGIRAVGLLH